MMKLIQQVFYITHFCCKIFKDHSDEIQKTPIMNSFNGNDVGSDFDVV